MCRPCVKCGATERYKNGKCGPCHRAYSLAKYANDPEKHRATVAAWRARNPEKVRELRAKWYADNPERQWAANSVWRAANPEKVRATTLAWAAANPDKIRTSNAAWAAANPEKVRVYHNNRRARESVGRLSTGLATKLFELQRGKCAYCRKPLGNDWHLDHIMPLSRGGTNTDDNIQLLHSSCNQRKHAKHPVDFMQERGFLI